MAVCRALGFPARLNPATGVPEYGEGDRFLPLPTGKALTVDAEEAGSGETGLLTLVNESGREMNYFEQYSVARLLDGVYQSLTLWGDVLKDRQTLSVEAGDYRILTSARQIDGSVLVRAYYTRVEAGEETVLPIALRPDRILEKLRFASLPLPDLESMGEKTQSLWSGRAFLLAFVEPGKEPTEHLLNELIALRDRYQQRKIPVAFVLFDKKAAENPRLQQAINVLPETRLFFCGDRGELHSLRRALHVGDERLPAGHCSGPIRTGIVCLCQLSCGGGGNAVGYIESGIGQGKGEMTMIQYAIIGTGKIVRTFLEASRKSAGIEALCRLFPQSGKSPGFWSGIRAERFYDSLETLAADPEVQAVYIASPNYCHCDQSIRMMEAGKHVLCEKPVASNLAEYEKMLETARRCGVIFFEAMRSVFTPE